MPRFARILVLLPLCSSAWGQRGYPRIETVFPGAVARGSTTEVMLAGRYNLRESTRVVFDQRGISATVVEWLDMGDTSPPPAKRKPFEREGLRIKVETAPDVMPGIYGFRILTKGSLSALAHLLVVAGACENESEPNESAAQAQTVRAGLTLNGRLDGDADTDHYRIEAKAGDRMAFLVHAARLQRPVPHLERDFSDIAISLHDAAGKELAAADDGLTEDPELAYVFERAGSYYLRLGEARYHSGKDKWWYALTITSDPVVRSAFPPVVSPGQRAKVHFEGFNLERLEAGEVVIPANAKGSFRFVTGSNRVELGVSDLPMQSEAESPGPRNLPIPAGISARILSDGETDRYRFAAKAGERFEFEVQARRWGSALDPLIEVRDVSGRILEAQDDMVNTVGQTVDGLSFPVNKDPRLEWMAPSDGEYEIDVRDANYYGGADRFYFLALRRQWEDFALVLDDDRMPVGPGESVTAVVTVERRNGFRGPVRLFVQGLPEGVFAHDSVIPAHMNQGNIVITAGERAKPDARPIVVGGRATVASADGKRVEIERIATPYAPMGQAGGRSFLHTPAAVTAVTLGSDIVLDANPKSVVLERGKSVTVKIGAKRDNYAGPVELNVVLWNLMQRFSKLPPGLVYEEKLSKTSLGPGETEGYVTFRAEGDAPALDDYLMAVMGQITYNRIFMTRVAAAFRLSIR